MDRLRKLEAAASRRLTEREERTERVARALNACCEREARENEGGAALVEDAALAQTELARKRLASSAELLARIDAELAKISG